MSDGVPVSPSLTVGSNDIREMSFQNVVDRILRPSGIKMGGFPLEMFIDLSDAEQQKFMCNICYMIANECHCCDNKHVFCHSCILAWSMTFGENAQKCPFCRCDQPEYRLDKELDDQLKEKRVCCLTDGCSYKAPLRFYLLHSHGRLNYSNADVDFARIQSEHRRFLPLPSLAALDADVAAGAMDIHEQLMQGRMMIHQMMLLMHLEMQLRQQALVSYQEAQDPAQRMRRLDDVMALNEQLNEVGSILGVLLNAPLDRGASVRLATNTDSLPAGHRGPSTLGGRFRAPVGDESAVGSLLPRFRVLNIDTDDDDDDDTSVGEVTDSNVPRGASDVAGANADDVFDEDFSLAGSSSDSSLWNSYNFDTSMPSSHRQARSTVAHTVSAERVSGETAVNHDIGHTSVVSGIGSDQQQAASTMPASSTLSATNGHSSVMLGRRHNQPSTPRWTRAEQTPVSVTVTGLHPPAGARSQVGDRTAPSQVVTLPQISSAAGAVAPTGRTSLAQNSDHGRLAMARRQMTVSGLSGGTSRQLESLSRNQPSEVSSGAHYRTNNQQTLPASSTSSSTSSSLASHLPDSTLDNSQPSFNGSGVLTEPWPIRPVTEHISTSLSTNRPAIAQPAARHDESGLSRANGALARNVRLSTGATAATHGPRRAVPETHNSRPALQLRRSSVRNVLGRAAGPASFSTLHPSPGRSPRVVPLPHPPVRGAHQQGSGDQSTAGSRAYASNDILRPRRRSEIAHDIMFPPQKDAEQ